MGRNHPPVPSRVAPELSRDDKIKKIRDRYADFWSARGLLERSPDRELTYKVQGLFTEMQDNVLFDGQLLLAEIDRLTLERDTERETERDATVTYLRTAFDPETSTEMADAIERGEHRGEPRKKT